MSESLICTFTAVGLHARVNAQNTGVKAELSHLAVGMGLWRAATQDKPAGYYGYVPTRSATGLVTETVRVPILSGEPLGDDAGFRVLAQVPSTSAPAEYFIQEVAAVLSTGVVLAIWSDPTGALAGKTARTDVDIAYDLILDGMPAGLLQITVTGPDIPDVTAVLAELIANQARLLAMHASTTERLRAGNL